MSGGLSGHGGAGGVTARYDDLLSAAGLLDDAADTLRQRGGDANSLILEGALAEAALLCPLEVVQVEGAATSAGLLPGSATWLGVELEAFSTVVEFSVEAYREVDQAMADLDDAFHDALGWAAGTGLGGAILTNPLAVLLLGGAAYLGKDELMELLHENPWLLESLIQSSPGLIQGLLLTLLGPGAIIGSDGNWPTTDFEQAVLGLQAFAQKFGLLHDTGEFPFEPTTVREGTDLSSLTAMADAEWTYAYHVDADGNPVPRIVVSQVGDPPSYVVHIPGTEVWDPQRGSNPYDLTSNITLMSQAQQAAIAAEVSRIVEGLDGPVMLVGHSQGGIIAAAVATNPQVSDQIQGVMTMGSPVATFDIPDHIATLSIENAHDAVPMLDGQPNPDQPNWTTITYDDTSTNIADAHSQQQYVDAAAAIDSGGLTGDVRDSLEQWQAQNSQFFGTATTTIYELPGPETGGSDPEE